MAKKPTKMIEFSLLNFKVVFHLIDKSSELKSAKELKMNGLTTH